MLSTLVMPHFHFLKWNLNHNIEIMITAVLLPQQPTRGGDH